MQRKRRRQYKFYHFLIILLAFSILIPLIVIVSRGPAPGRYYEHATREILAAQFSSNGQQILVGGGRDLAWLHDLETNTITHVFGGHERGVAAVALSEAQSMALTVDKNGLAQLWDTDSGRRIGRYQAHTFLDGHRIDSQRNAKVLAALSSDGRRAVFKDGFGDVVLWDIESNRTQTIEQESHVNEILSMAVTPDSRYVLLGLEQRTGLQVIDLENVHSKRFVEDCPQTNHVLVSEIGSVWVTTGGDRSVRYARLDRDEPPKRIAHSNTIFALAISRDGTKALIGGSFNDIKLWNLSESLLLGDFYVPDDMADLYPSKMDLRKLLALGFGEDNTFLSLEQDGEIVKRTIPNGRILWTIDGYSWEGGNRIKPAESVIDPVAVERKTNQQLAEALQKPIAGTHAFADAPFSEVLYFVIEKSQLPFNTETISRSLLPLYYGKGTHTGKEFFDRYLKYRLYGPFDYSFDSPNKITLVSRPQNAAPSETPPEVPELNFTITPPWEFNFIDYHDLMNQVKERTGLDYEIDEDIYPLVNETFTDASIATYLKTLLLPNKLDYLIENGEIIIGRESRIIPLKEMQKELGSMHELSASKNGFEFTFDREVTLKDRPLSEFLDTVAKESGLSFHVEADSDVLVSCNLYNPSVGDLLNAILPEHGLFYALQKDGSIRIATFDRIERDGEAIFTPVILSAFWQYYQAQFANSHLIYEGTIPVRAQPFGYAQTYEKQNRDLQYILEHKLNQPNPDPTAILSVPSSMLPFLKLSDQDIQNKIEDNKRIIEGYSEQSIRDYSVRGDIRLYLETNANQPKRYYQWQGSFGMLYQYTPVKPNSQPYAFSFSFRDPSDVSRAPSQPGTPFRYGCDLDWFLKRGYTIRSYHNETRVVRLQRHQENANTYYEFTLLDGHNAYWKECRLTYSNRSADRIICEDFQDINGMLVPKTVYIDVSPSSQVPARASGISTVPRAHGLILKFAQVNDADLPPDFYEPPKDMYFNTAELR